MQTAPVAAQAPARQVGSRPPRILVFRIGSLGDTLVALPSLWSIREHFPGSKVTFLCDGHVGPNVVVGADVVKGTGLVDDFVVYPVRGSRLVRSWRLVQLLFKLRWSGYDVLAYLAPSTREPERVRRDRRFFRLAGIPRLIGFQGIQGPTPPRGGRPLPVRPSEADLILGRLAHDGLAVPREGQGRMELPVGEMENRQADHWLAQRLSSGGRSWVAVAPGSNMPAKVWPIERYAAVVSRLIADFDIWPIIVGGPQDRVAGEDLVRTWGRGYVAAGDLSLLASAAVIARCRFYLGNDTGAMHMAAAVAVRCVAVFCSHSPPGLWYPYGRGHHVFRTPIDCEGCRFRVCLERKMECILRIGVEEVYASCAKLLSDPQIA